MSYRPIKPILFNTEMVRAILDGRKTVTRRVIKPSQMQGIAPDRCPNHTPEEFVKEKSLLFKPYCDMTDEDMIKSIFKAPYQVGDILYVRETWGFDNHNWLYKADFSEEDLIKLKRLLIWHPSIHMPKETARIFLKVTDVRVERLQDITEEDAIKEGCKGTPCEHHGYIVGGGMCGCTDCMNTGWLEPPTLEFMELWNSTIKNQDLDSYGWNANPWVWVIEFERIMIRNSGGANV